MGEPVALGTIAVRHPQPDVLAGAWVGQQLDVGLEPEIAVGGFIEAQDGLAVGSRDVDGLLRTVVRRGHSAQDCGVAGGRRSGEGLAQRVAHGLPPRPGDVKRDLRAFGFRAVLRPDQQEPSAFLADDVVDDGLVAVRTILGHPQHSRQDAAHVAILLPHVGGQQPQAVVGSIRERRRAPAADLLAVVRVQGREPKPHRVAELGVVAQQHLAREVQGRDQPVAAELAGIAPVVAHPRVVVIGSQHRGVVVTRLEADEVPEAVAVAAIPAVARRVGTEEEEQAVVTDQHPVAPAAAVTIALVLGDTRVEPLVPTPLAGGNLFPVLRRVVRVIGSLRADDGVDVRQVFDDADVGPLGPTRRVVGRLEAVVDQQQVLR